MINAQENLQPFEVAYTYAALKCRKIYVYS